MADAEQRQPAARRRAVVGALAVRVRRARPPLRRRAGALARGHRRAVRPPQRALAAPRHHPGDLAAHARRPPAEGAALAPRRALGPRLRRRRRSSRSRSPTASSASSSAPAGRRSRPRSASSRSAASSSRRVDGSWVLRGSPPDASALGRRRALAGRAGDLLRPARRFGATSAHDDAVPRSTTTVARAAATYSRSRYDPHRPRRTPMADPHRHEGILSDDKRDEARGAHRAAQEGVLDGDRDGDELHRQLDQPRRRARAGDHRVAPAGHPGGARARAAVRGAHQGALRRRAGLARVHRRAVLPAAARAPDRHRARHQGRDRGRDRRDRALQPTSSSSPTASTS